MVADKQRKRRPVGRPAIMRELTVNADVCKRTTRLAMLGCTHETIAEQLEIDMTTFYDWMKKFPEFSQAVKAGAIDADAIVASKMFRAATGNKRTVEQAIKLKDADGEERVEVVETVVEDPLNVSAQIFWLKNRQRKLWQDIRGTELAGPGGAAIEFEHKHTIPARSLSPDERDKLRAFLEAQQVTDVEDLNEQQSIDESQEDEE